jgi:Flp pilus assembly protein TadD
MESLPSAARQPTAPQQSQWRWLLGSLVAVLGLGLAGVWIWQPRADQPAPMGDPRATFATPYRNVRPEVRYVGDETCAECHPSQAETYRQHPMGRSLAPVSQVAASERYDAAAHNPFEQLGFEFAVERHGERVFHKERRRDVQGRVLTELEAEVHFAIGSGTRGRTYLVDRNGALFQSPISWFSQLGVWDLTPKFDVLEHFERPAQPECLFCHSNQVEPAEHTLNQYRPPLFRGHAIGCERCHGPGELHVQARERGEVFAGLDETIVNPRHLSPPLRESVCQQCHLQGESRIVRRDRRLFAYRPGLPLHLFVSVFLRLPDLNDNQKAGSHAWQMSLSRCFRASEGKLGCISCHDPHEKPAPQTKMVYFRGRCLSCHGESSCRLPLHMRRTKNPADSCIDCHMPRAPSSNIAHTAVTDHRIVRQPDHAVPSGVPPRRLRPGEVPLYHFHRDLVDPQDKDVARDLGLALTELVRDYPTLAKHAATLALPLLEESVQRWPEDVAAWEGKGFALWRLERKEEAWADLATVLARAPQRETTLTYAAALATALGRNEVASAYWQRAIAVNPWSSQYRYQLARLLAQRGDWRQAVEAGDAACRLNPASDAIRTLLITSLIRAGNTERARKEFDILLALNPADQDVLRRWLAEQMGQQESTREHP